MNNVFVETTKRCIKFVNVEVQEFSFDAANRVYVVIIANDKGKIIMDNRFTPEHFVGINFNEVDDE